MTATPPDARVLVTGLGAVSPSGLTAADTWAAWLRGDNATRAAPDAIRQYVPNALAAMVPEGWQARVERAHQGADRSVQLATVAAAEALAQAGLEPPGARNDENDEDDENGERRGVYVGIGLAGAQTIDGFYSTFYERLYRPELSGHRDPALTHPLTVPRLMANAAAAALSIRYRIRGPSYTYSVACASSAIALGEAYRAIRAGWIDRALVVGCEAMIVAGAFRAWHALRVLAQPDADDPAASCKPFDARRNGFVLGEGAAAIVLESEAAANARGAGALARLAGYGASSDAGHLTAPSVAGQARAMRAALADAGLTPADIGHINAHGTATAGGDVAETESIKQVFAERAARLPISATKSMHGHLIGAAGALEFIGAVRSLTDGIVPPTANLRVRDPRCDLDYVAEGARAVPGLRHVLTNSFAFGGANACLVAAKL